MTAAEMTALFALRMPWDRGYLQPVTSRIEYEAVAKDSAAPLPDSQPVGGRVEHRELLVAKKEQA